MTTLKQIMTLAQSHGLRVEFTTSDGVTACMTLSYRDDEYNYCLANITFENDDFYAMTIKTPNVASMLKFVNFWADCGGLSDE